MSTPAVALELSARTTIRPLAESELDEADSIFRLAFGTFIGMPDPTLFAHGVDYVHTRWSTNPGAAFAAEVDGRLAGSNFATNWGSVGFFGPLTVHPEHWDQGVGSLLMEPVLERFADWGTTHQGLFTFAHSPKHIELYRKFGFWPRSLTAIMRKPVQATNPKPGWSLYSEFAGTERSACVTMCRQLTDSVYDGLDLTLETAAVHDQSLGDTVLLLDGSTISGLAVCHLGAGTEAGDGVCLVKFGAVRAGTGAAERFERLLDACEDLAAERGLSFVEAGINLARSDAYGALTARGYRTGLQGVAMHRPNTPGYSHPNAYVIDDWR